MFNRKLTADQRLTKAVVNIMDNPRYVALSGVLMVGSKRIDPTVPTAYTNGRDEVYGEAFVDSLNDAELRFLVLHECYHKLYRHLTTWKNLHDIDHQLANAACDYVINLKIAEDNEKTPEFARMPHRDGIPLGLIDVKYRGMNAAEVFKLLMEDRDGDDGEGEGDDGEGEGDADGDAGGSNSNGTSRGKGKSSGTGLDDHDWEGAQEMSEAEKTGLARDIDEAIRQGALVAGKLGTGGDRDLQELLKPQVDWREALRDFITTTCAGNDFSTWSRPNRRFVSSGYYMPSGVSERVGELVIAIDASGSTYVGNVLAQFLTEVKSIADTVKPEAVRVLYWDTQVTNDERYVGDEIATLTSNTKIKGGGGTTVSCVSDYIAEHAIKAQAVVVLTDGFLGGDWGSINQPTLWCIVGNNSTTAPYGKTIHVEEV